MDLRYSHLKFIMMFGIFIMTVIILLSFGFIGRELTYFYELTTKDANQEIPSSFVGSINSIMAWNVFMLLFFPVAVYSSFNHS